MWLIAALFTALAAGAGLWETYALKTQKLTITDFVRTHPHAAIIILSSVFLALGYAIGVGGQ